MTWVDGILVEDQFGVFKGFCDFMLLLLASCLFISVICLAFAWFVKLIYLRTARYMGEFWICQWDNVM